MASLDYNPELRTIRLGDVPMAPGTPSSHEDGQPPFPSAPGAFYSTSAVCSVSPFTNRPSVRPPERLVRNSRL
jgi:hypothetical protein